MAGIAGNFREKQLDKKIEELEQSPFPAKVETSNAGEDYTGYRSPYEILTPEEAEKLEIEERMAKVKVPAIQQEVYDELEKALKEGEKENAFKVEKSILKYPPKSKPVKKETFLGRIKNIFGF